MKYLILIIGTFLLCCRKPSHNSYFIFYQETPSIAPVEVYLDGELIGEIDEPFNGLLEKCEPEKGMLKKSVEANRLFQIVFKIGLMSDTIYEYSEINDCRVVILE